MPNEGLMHSRESDVNELGLMTYVIVQPKYHRVRSTCKAAEHLRKGLCQLDLHPVA